MAGLKARDFLRCCSTERKREKERARAFVRYPENRRPEEKKKKKKKKKQ